MLWIWLNTIIRCDMNPKLGPPLPSEQRAPSFAYALRELMLGSVPPLVLIGACLGSILFGLTTPTEGAAMGAFGVSALGLANRRLKLRMILESTWTTADISGMVLFLGMAANVYEVVFTRLGSSTLILKSLMAIPLPPMGIILLFPQLSLWLPKVMFG